MNSNDSHSRWRIGIGQVAAGLTLAMIVAACGDGAAEAGTLSVVVTTTILGDVVENVAAGDATVEVLFPVGADPHEYQPSSQAVAALNQADLVVVNGLGLEEGMIDIIQAAEADGVNVLELAPALDPIPLGSAHECDPLLAHEHAEHTDEEHATHVGSCDPHIWMDPLRMADGAGLIAAELASLDDSVDWEARATSYASDLKAADNEMAELLAAVPAEDRVLVTNHDNLGYFAARYGYEVMAAVIPGGSTLAQPSSEELANLVALMIAQDVSVIFTETIDPATLAQAVAAEVGENVRVVDLYTDSLGESGSEADTLVGLLMTNAERISEALGK